MESTKITPKKSAAYPQNKLGLFSLHKIIRRSRKPFQFQLQTEATTVRKSNKFEEQREHMQIQTLRNGEKQKES